MVENPNAVLGREAMSRDFTFTCFMTRDGAGWKVAVSISRGRRTLGGL